MGNGEKLGGRGSRVGDRDDCSENKSAFKFSSCSSNYDSASGSYLNTSNRSPHSPLPTPYSRSSALLLILLFAIITPVFSASLEELVGAERAGELKTATEPASPMEPITESQLKNPSPRLLPRHDALQRFVAENMQSLEPNLLVETISLYHKPSGSAVWSRVEQIGLFNQLTAISTLAGIQYYSESRKAMRTFYETSQVIDSPEHKKTQPDPVHSVLPNSLVIYARQKDLTFGDNIYRLSYYTAADAIFFVQENITAMNAGIIPAVGKNKFRTVIAVIDAGDTLVLYAAAMAKAVALPGMGDRISDSFSNRIVAILKWFSDGVKVF